MSKFSNYLQAISRVNGLACGLDIEWLFYSGMSFSSREKWWGDFKIRHAIHEGIDITYFRTGPDELKCFDVSTKVPAMDDGVILNICDDFLGQTLVVEQESSQRFNTRILFAYAHVIPETQLKIGQTIHKEDIIARVSDTHKNPELPPHLHFSCFEAPGHYQPERLDWKLFSGGTRVNLIHPVFL